MLARARCSIGFHRPDKAKASPRKGSWISRCRDCRRPMTYSAGSAWRMLPAPPPSTTPVWRPLGIFCFVVLSLAPIQSSAAQKDAAALLASGQIRGTRIPLADLEIRNLRDSGMNCRSRFDGSNEDAVRLVRAGLPNPGSYVHIETQFWPQENGRNAFAMTYTSEDDAGHRQLGRAFGSVDSASCKARLTRA